MTPANGKNDASSALCAAICARSAAGEISPQIAVMELLIACEDVDDVSRYIASARARALARQGEELSDAAARAFDQISQLLAEHAGGCARIASMLRSGMDSPPDVTEGEGSDDAAAREGILFCQRLFDWSVQQSEEASVALYSLGSPEILANATREIVGYLDSKGLLRPQSSVLEIGCGIGRIERAIADRVRSAHGIDVSPRMIEVARRRCESETNLEFSVCSGRDLGAFVDGAFDLVFAVDSFPYLVQSSMALVRSHFAEAARVLCPGGDFVILNFSYREDDPADRRDVSALARDAGLTVVDLGTHPFALWNGAAFHLRRP